MRFEHGYNASIIAYKGLTPKIHPSAFLCEGVRIIGDVEIGKDASIWYNTVIRGDVHYVKIGEGTNVQDLSMLHVTNQKHPLIIGNHISIGHSVSLHGCTIDDHCLIGIGATVLDGAKINKHCLVAAGTLVKEGFEVPEGTMIAGVPGKIIRELTDEQIEKIKRNADNYIKYVAEFRSSIGQM